MGALGRRVGTFSRSARFRSAQRCPDSAGRAWAGLACGAVVALLACTPDLGTPASLVTSERLLAVRAEPPEVAPGESVALTSLVASPDGTVANASIAWAMCAAPKPLAENDVVSTACVGDAVRPVADGASSASATIPTDACALFGPETPPGDYRPRSPDVTGGYYQPVRATLADVPSFALERIACHLTEASADVAADYAKRYPRNKNPQLAPLVARMNGAPVPLDQVPAGARVTFTAAWGPSDAETYVVFDTASQSLVTKREAMRVSWYASGGRFDTDVTGRTEDDPATTSDVGWTAPGAAGAVHVWLVLRDSRGGLDFAAQDIIVR